MACNGKCSECDTKEKTENCAMELSLGKIKNKIAVMSGKGGVGKSTVAVNLAYALALEGMNVGLLDVDFHGPSIPTMLHLEDARPESDGGDKILPVTCGPLKVISLGFFTERPEDAVIWRGPMKIGVIKQMLSDVVWGELDYLVIDCPPGTGDEPLSVCQMIPDGQAVIVTTPQRVAAADVAKSLNFCEQLKYKVLGIVENMSGFVCPDCGKVTEIFATGAGEQLSGKFNIPLLGKLPIDPRVCQSGDDGRPFVHDFAKTPVGKEFLSIVGKII